MTTDPLGLTAVMGAYTLAFVLRGAIWRRVLPRLSLGHAIAGVHVTLLGNHVLPFRLGEPLRAVSVVVRAGVPIGAAVASTVTMRAADILGVAVLGMALAPGILFSLLGAWGLALLFAAGAAASIVGLWWLRRHPPRAAAQPGSFRMPGTVVALGALGAWVLESGIMWLAAGWVGSPISPAAAIVATCVTVGAQILAVAPAGFGTFEAAGTAALAAVGVPAGRALAVTLIVHGVTTLYSLVAGAVALVVPKPAMGPRALAAALRRGPAQERSAAALEAMSPLDHMPSNDTTESAS
jgi:uncharacterized membrane protein YbhN (UPF0104 family)